MDRLTKSLVLVSAIGALAFEAVNAGLEIFLLPWLSLAAGLVTLALGRRWPDRTAGIVLAAGAIAPVLFIVTIGHFRLWYLSVWKGALVGACAGTTALTWHYPPRLRFPFTAWALAVAVVWPIVALRELDWTPALLWSWPLTVSSAVHAVTTAVWIAQIAQLHLLPLLLVDWLFARVTPSGLPDWERAVVRPMLTAALLGAGVAIYQGLVDLRAMSIGDWAAMGRATGALADANPSGSLAALWIAIPFGLLAGGVRRGETIVLSLVPPALLAAVWMTGSRTALLGAAVGIAGGLHILLTMRGRRWIGAAAVAAVLVSGAAVVVAPPTSVMGPVVRIQSLLPDLSPASMRAVATELWRRNGYGTVSAEMIRDEPVHGVGLGLVHDMTMLYTARSLPADNAQNWFRHQLAELGVLGSLGWMLSIPVIAWTMAAGRPAGENRTRAIALRYAIAGFGGASLIGMPGQNVIVALTLAVLVFWLLRVSMPDGVAASSGRRRTATQLAALAAAVAFATLTWHAGWRELRPPFRAKRFEAGYRYGFYVPFEGPSGRTVTDRHAVTVAAPLKPWLKLSVWVDHPDANERPVRVQVWRDHQRIVSGRFGRGVPLTRYVRVGDDGKPFVLETLVDRTYSPSEGRYPEAGLGIEWEFVDSAPAAERARSE